MGTIAGYYFCRLIEGDQIDPTDRGGLVNSAVRFRFRRKLDDDSKTPDSYWPNNRSARNHCLNHGCTPPVPMPSGARIEFVGSEELDPIPEPVSSISFPAELDNSYRDSTRADYQSAGEPPHAITVEFGNENGIVEQQGPVSSWSADAFALNVRIIISDNAGSSYQLVFLDAGQSVSIVPIDLSALRPMLGQLLPATVKPFSFTNSEVLLLGNPNICDFPNNPLALTTGRPEDDETGTIVYSGQPLWTGYFADGKWGTYPRVGNQQNLAFVSHVLVQLARLYCIPANAIEVGSHFNMNWSFQNPWFQETYDNFFLTHPHTAFPYQWEVGIGIGDAFMVLKPISTVIGSGSRLWEVRIAGAAPLPMVTGAGTAIVCSLRYDCIEWSAEQSRYQVSWNQCGTLVNPPNPNGGFIATKIHGDGTIAHATALRCYKLEPQTYDPLVHGTGNQIWITSAYQSTWTDEPHALDLGFDAGLQIVGPPP